MQTWAEKLYASPAWKHCRESYLQSVSYLCEKCTTAENPNVAKIVHHKVYLTEENINDPEIALAWDNLQAVCQDCHNREHHAVNDKRYIFGPDGGLVYVPPTS